MAIFGALAPILIPAAIGAFTSAAMGRNPLQGAVMGGITGGLLGPAGGNLFNLGSSTAAATESAVSSAASGGATAFGASQAPNVLANTSLLAPEAITSTAMNNAYTGPVSSTVGNIHTAYGMSPESIVASKNIPISKYASAINTSDPVQLAKAAKETTGQTFIDTASDANFNIADQIRPRFEDVSRVTEQATKTGGYEKPLYERAYESVINYAKKNPLEVGGLALVASGGIKPRTPQQPVTGSGGSITKGTPPQQVGQILKVRRPTRFA